MTDKKCIAKCDNGYTTYITEDHLGKKTKIKTKCSFCNGDEE